MFWNTQVAKLARRAFLGLAILAFVIVSIIWSIIQFRKDWILQQFVSYLNEKQSGSMEMGELDLSIFTHFPQASIEITNVHYYEHRPDVRTADEQPLLMANHLYGTIDIWKLITRSELRISAAGLNDASVWIEKDTEGQWNFQRALNSRGGTGKGLTLDLNLIRMQDLQVKLKTEKQSTPMIFTIKDFDASVAYSPDSISCSVRSVQVLNSLDVKKFHFSDLGDFETVFKLAFHKKSKELVLSEGSLKYKALALAITGSYSPEEKKKLDVVFQASSSDFALVSELIRQDVIKLNPQLLSGGKSYLKGRIFGELENESAQMECTAGAREIDIQMPEGLGAFKNVGFEVAFRSGDAADMSKAELSVTKLAGSIPGGFVSGYVRVKDLKSPVIDCDVSLKTNLQAYDRVFNITSIRDLKGHLSLAVKLKNYQSARGGRLRSVRSAQLDLKVANLSFTGTKTGKRLELGSADVSASTKELELKLNDLRYDSSDLQIAGIVSNPFDLLVHRDTSVMADLHFRSHQLMTSVFIPDSGRTAQIDDALKNLELDLNLSTSVDNIWSQHGIPDCRFAITKLSAGLKRLPDMKDISAEGQFVRQDEDKIITLDQFHALLQQGSIDLKGSLKIGQKGRRDVDASIALRQLPWNYVSDIAAEINDKPYEGARFLSPDKMELVDADLLINAQLISRPFAIQQLKIRNGKAGLALSSGVIVKAENLDLDVQDLFFKRSGETNAVSGIQSLEGGLRIGTLILPGIGKTSLNLQANAVDDQKLSGTTLDIQELDLQMPRGRMTLQGRLAMPTLRELNLQTDAQLSNVSWNSLTKLLSIIRSQIPEESRLKNTEVTGASLHFTTSWLFKPFQINTLKIEKSQLDLHWSDSLRIKATDFSADITDLQFRQQNDSVFSMIKSVHGTADVPTLQIHEKRKIMLHLEVEGNNGQFGMNFRSDLLEGESNRGELQMDFSRKPYDFRLRYASGKISAAALAGLFMKKRTFEGPVEFRMDLQASGVTRKEVVHTIQGGLTLSSDSLILYGLDLDQLLNDYRKSQNFNLVDVGAFMLTGPVGPVLTKGNDFARLLSTKVQPDDKTELVRFFTNWNISSGVIAAEDVAFATRQNRVAFLGKIDFEHDTIPGFTVAVVDRKGCSIMDQQLYGKLNRPLRGKANVMGALLGSVTNAVDAVAPTGCKVVYNGAVKHPK